MGKKEDAALLKAALARAKPAKMPSRKPSTKARGEGKPVDMPAPKTPSRGAPVFQGHSPTREGSTPMPSPDWVQGGGGSRSLKKVMGKRKVGVR